MAALGGMQVPAVHLNEVHLEIREDPDGTKYIVMGPIALVLPLDAEAVTWLEDKLKTSKVQIVPAGAIANLRTPGS